MSTRIALIVAGGSGSRMGADIPKQFLSLGGKPVLLHTLERFLNVCDKTILVLPATEQPRWFALAGEYTLTDRVQVVAGGSTRTASVRNGLNAIEELSGLVAIHDAVRPFITEQLILRSFELAQATGSAVAAVALKDSIRKIDGDASHAVDRSMYQAVQTPQTFDLKRIKDAYATASEGDFTDDASVYEAAGGKVNLFTGAYTNIKITTPDDLVLGEAILRSLSS